MWEELRRYWDIVKASWDEERRAGPAVGRTRDEREFLAAAIELTETPASPAGRLVVWFIVSFFSIALLWACIGKLDIHATLLGKVIPTGNVKVIEPLEPGTVRAIHVEDGDLVEEGALLLDLDPTDSTVDRRRLRHDLSVARLEVARLRETVRAGMESLAAADAHLDTLPGAEPDDVALQREVLIRAIEAHRAAIDSIDAEVAQRSAERSRFAGSAAERRKLVAVREERTAMYKKLVESHSGSRLGYLNAAETMYDERANLATEEGQLREAEAAIAALERRKKEIVADFLSKGVSDLADAQKRVAGLEQEYLKASQRDERNRLYAPVRGVVRQLAVHTIGEVVTTGEKLMTIVPAETTLEVEAMLLNRDKGFVVGGQHAEIKVDAFPFTKYGTISGKVVDVSNDAVETKEQGLVFPARITMDRAAIHADGHDVPLTPGMSVQVEARTGERRVIEYLLTPLLRYRDEAIRER